MKLNQHIYVVIPAQAAGRCVKLASSQWSWIPAFAGTTREVVRLHRILLWRASLGAPGDVNFLHA